MNIRNCIKFVPAAWGIAFIVVTWLPAAATAATLICAKKNQATGLLKEGSDVRLRTTCKSNEVAVPLSALGLLPDIGVGVGNYDNPPLVSVPNGASFFVPFTSEAWDTANMHDPGAPTDLVAPVAGRYLVTAAVGFAETASPTNPAFNLRELLILKSGGGSFGQVLINATESIPVEETMMTTSAILDLAVGEIVRILVTQSSGGPLNLVPSSQAQMQKVN